MRFLETACNEFNNLDLNWEFAISSVLNLTETSVLTTCEEVLILLGRFVRSIL